MFFFQFFTFWSLGIQINKFMQNISENNWQMSAKFLWKQKKISIRDESNNKTILKIIRQRIEQRRNDSSLIGETLFISFDLN